MLIYLVVNGINTIVELNKRFGVKPHYLTSFIRVGLDFSHYLHTHRHRIGKIMLDSGAYSEMVGTAIADFDSYLAYLKPCSPFFNYCINLDKDPENYDVRMWNLAKLKSEGLDVLPCVHDPYAGEIDQLYDMGYSYILLGSSWGKDRKQLDFIFNRYYYSGKYPGIKLHKLGTATYNGLYDYPYYSSDSATFVHIGGMGEVLYWNEHREPKPNGDQTDLVYFGGFQTNRSKRSPDWYNYSYIGEFEDYVWKTFEYRLSDLEGPEGAVKRWIVNGKYTLDLQELMTQLHG